MAISRRRRAAGGHSAEPHHWRRLIGIWAVLSAIATPLCFFFVGYHIPPGNMTDAANGTQFDARVLMTAAIPVTIAVLLYFVYAMVVWRQPKDQPLMDGPPLRTHLAIQTAWITVTSAIVFGLFIFGTYELIVPAGAGGGEGPSPIWTPASHQVLPIQVIGQQWRWTYRYPTFGGFETDALVLPVNTTVAFHVTSLDVIHDWWAYQLGIKADANPNIDNVAFATTKQMGRFVVRCDELCGLWHGAMYNYGTVVSKSGFESWATSTQTKLAALTKTLPAFQWTYSPSANGADGGFYPTDKDQYSNLQNYGAQKVNLKKLTEQSQGKKVSSKG
ncbi:MAG: hypothetical protein ACRDYD_03035 [Acidimicrobiales bacterium]